MEESDMSEPLLNVKNLSVDVEEKSILHGISLTINKGETHVLMGPNGAGKSTLGCTLMGNPNYHVTDGEIFFGGENITKEAAGSSNIWLNTFLDMDRPLPQTNISPRLFPTVVPRRSALFSSPCLQLLSFTQVYATESSVYQSL